MTDTEAKALVNIDPKALEHACNVRLSRTLTNLRNNAFLTDERGVRVKYANASREVRAKAETL